MARSELDRGEIYFHEYVAALKQHYPALVDQPPPEQHSYTKMDTPWLLTLGDAFRADEPHRFQPPNRRAWGSDALPWVVNIRNRSTVRSSYKGLLCVKSPLDLVLYHNLIWELRPQTIIELGALQGGSSLWFADQLAMISPTGEVHSYERMMECISPRAAHPRLHFHEVDLEDVSNFDTSLLDRLPHPWLVVDDAHTNMENVFAFLASHMHVGDYIVLEDVLLYAPASQIRWIDETVTAAGFCVDSRYTDAFGYNVTTAPNGWLRKMR